MFISMRRQGYEGTEQVASGRFLILCQPKGWENRNAPIRALVQFHVKAPAGQLHDGNGARLWTFDYLSGLLAIRQDYSCNVPQGVYDRAITLPEWLHEAWNKGRGVELPAGNGAPAMRQWARATFPAPRKHSLASRTAGLRAKPH